ncbi:hypothetical protein DFH08DRAFT_815954 [Mycena albidolilacea]|uniref:Uncharacterized protein n=1 Tax=Mycena albidolilacea TaxID=1033008 RepID=A0AAD6ZMA3_9AGAR|nr:hypothetical protein DFH08DRAFT_815954 [Mycena albidolilacea]
MALFLLWTYTGGPGGIECSVQFKVAGQAKRTVKRTERAKAAGDEIEDSEVGEESSSEDSDMFSGYKMEWTWHGAHLAAGCSPPEIWLNIPSGNQPAPSCAQKS